MAERYVKTVIKKQNRGVKKYSTRLSWIIYNGQKRPRTIPRRKPPNPNRH